MSFDISYVVNDKLKVEIVEKYPIIGRILEPHNEGFVGKVSMLGYKLLWEQETDNNNRRAYVSTSARDIYIPDTEGNVVKYDGKGKQLETFKIHTGAINNVRVGENDGRIFTGGYTDNLVKCTNRLGEILWTYHGHTQGVTSVALDESRGVVYSCGEDGKLVKLNASDGNVIWEKTFPSRIDDVTVDHNGFIYFVSSLDTVKLNVDGEEVWKFSGPHQTVRLVYNSGYVYVGTIHGELRKLNALNGESSWNNIVTGANRWVFEIVVDTSLGRVYAFGNGINRAIYLDTGDSDWDMNTVISDYISSSSINDNKLVIRGAALTGYNELIMVAQNNWFISLDGKSLYHNGYNLIG